MSRYIGLTDNVDSERDDGFIPIRAYFNEQYCRDISGKIHATYDIKAKEGQFTGCLAPFGYKKDPADQESSHHRRGYRADCSQAVRLRG